MQKDKSVKALRLRYDRLTARLARVGLVLQGTITERTVVREDPYSPGKEKTYGPYYQWTFKEKGKTKTVNLTASQARVFQKAIENNRKLNKTIQEMREISLNICEATTEGVNKRKSRI
jgi:hypothetical protein